MKVKGLVSDTPISILIDSSSTHNFLDISIAKKLGCTTSSMSPQAVIVADDNHIACQHKCE